MKSLSTRMLLTLFILSLTVGIFSLLSLSDAFILFAWIHLGLALLSAGLLVLRRGRDGEARLVLPGSRALSKFVNYLLVIILAILSYQAVGRFLKFEYDATSNKAHSLAKESQNVLSSVNEKVEILGFFLGAKPPEHIAELLNKFTRNSSNITWRGLDPDKERPLVEAYGISEKDTLFIKKINDNTSGIKVSRDINEETLTNALRKLVSGRKANILTLSGHGEGDIANDKEAGFLFLKEAIEGEGYKVPTSMTLLDLKPSKESFLLLIAPTTTYLPEELTQIKNYFENGGSGLVLLEPNRNSDLSGLFSGFGFKIGNDTIVDKEMFTMGESRLGVQPIVDSYSKHVAVDGFKKSIVFSTLRSVRKEPMADSIQELAFTSESSWGETNLVDLYSKSPKALKDESDNQGPISIAATLEREVGGLRQRLVVIGDSEFVANINLRQLFNRDFILNLINWAIGEDAPVTIRAGTLEKSEIVISESTYMQLFMFLGILLPECLILWSVFMWGKRRA